MDGKQRELQAVRNADLVEDIAQGVLDHLFAGVELQSDVAVLESLHNRGNDAQLSVGEAVSYARADKIFADFAVRPIGALQERLAARQPAHSLYHNVAARAAVNDALHAHSHEVGGALIVLHKHQQCDVSAGRDSLDFRQQRQEAGGENHTRPEFVERIQQLFGRLRLSDDANVFLNRQHLGDAGAKDHLVIGNDYVDHI